jgi:formyltetrahydrofolate synthetase
MTKNATSFEAGKTGNPNGRPKGRGKPVSRLRSTLSKLRELEQQALDNIADSVGKKNIDKEVIATSKWVITTIVAVNKAANAEEALLQSIREYNDMQENLEQEQELKREGSTNNVVRFTTKLVKEYEDQE